MDSWDDWFGQLTLAGVDPRSWDLGQMLAAFETALRQNAKDESEWRRTLARLTAEPKEVRDQRRKAVAAGLAAPGPSRMSVDDAEALVARFTAADALYG